MVLHGLYTESSFYRLGLLRRAIEARFEMIIALVVVPVIVFHVEGEVAGAIVRVGRCGVGGGGGRCGGGRVGGNVGSSVGGVVSVFSPPASSAASASAAASTAVSSTSSAATTSGDASNAPPPHSHRGRTLKALERVPRKATLKMVRRAPRRPFSPCTSPITCRLWRGE